MACLSFLVGAPSSALLRKGRQAPAEMQAVLDKLVTPEATALDAEHA